MRAPSPVQDLAVSLLELRSAQERWARTPLRDRLRVVRRFRHLLAGDPLSLAATVPAQVPGSLRRSTADTLVAEVLPLAEACRFLEREAVRILSPRRASGRSRPSWLSRVEVLTSREPHGVVLVIGPANYPLFLAAAQALQALAAGNAVLWKPAETGSACAEAVHYLLREAGLDPHLLRILDTSPAAAQQAIAAGVDKVVLTGQVDTGRAVLHQCADSLTPATTELSGCDAVFVLPGADANRAAHALAFGLRFNGSATCMAPRRLFVAAGMADTMVAALRRELARLPLTPLPPQIGEQARQLLREATACGASVLADGVECEERYESLRYALVLDATPEMRIAESDIFAPVLSVFRYSSDDSAVEVHNACPYSLTAAIFGPERHARALGRRLRAGVVVVNDLIVATADPRVAFGGRGRSGFGSTRGEAGLLEMTTPKTMAVQRSRGRRPYMPATEAHAPLFAGFLQAMHGGGWRTRLAGIRAMLRAGRSGR